MPGILTKRQLTKENRERGSVAVRLVGIAALALAIFIAISCFYLFKGSSEGAQKSVLLPRGSSLAKVADILSKEGVVSSKTLFKNALRLTQVFGKVQAGEFLFKENMKPVDALRVLYFSEPITHQVTVPEGWTVRQIAVLLEQAGLVNARSFIRLGLETPPPSRYKIPAPTLEGFLFPETYKFSKIDGEERILDTMVQQFMLAYDKYIRPEEKNIGMDMLQIVTLASIVEKETGVASERDVVSSVFHNRLKKGMRLQSDPTTIYGIMEFDGNLTKKHLQEKTAYNTYKIKGLPPGPIANPGLAALQATVKPANTKYFYFVGNNKGQHLFSETYEQHARKVSTYQTLQRQR